MKLRVRFGGGFIIVVEANPVRSGRNPLSRCARRMMACSCDELISSSDLRHIVGTSASIHARAAATPWATKLGARAAARSCLSCNDARRPSVTPSLGLVR